MYTLIDSAEELKKHCSNKTEEFFILLSGILRSSKSIIYHTDSKKFDVLNEIDWTTQKNLTEEDLKTKTLIVEAIEKKNFYKYNF